MKLIVIALSVLLLAGLALFARGQQSAEQHGATSARLLQLYPNHTLTPGQTVPGVTAAAVCVKGYASHSRAVTGETRRTVLHAYGVTKSSGYEVDHFIPLELGGTNDAANLWPEPLSPSPGAHEKDWVEDRLHREVCAGRLTLAAAQQEIATDWYAVYRSLHK